MSGGHWNYDQYRAKDLIYEMGSDSEIILKAPKLSQFLRDFSELFETLSHDLDWHLSSDTIINDFEKYEKDFIVKLGKIINKKYKIKVYEIEEEK